MQRTAQEPHSTRSPEAPPTHAAPAPAPFPGAAETPLLEAADRLTRRVAEATAELPGAGRRLGYALRESAVLAQAGAAAACRQPLARDRRQGLAATDRCLDRLATWLGLAERFGDLPPPIVLALLEELSRVRVELLTLAGAAGPAPGLR